MFGEQLFAPMDGGGLVDTWELAGSDVFGPDLYSDTYNSAPALSAPVDSTFFTGIDSLDGLLNGYFRFQELEFQREMSQAQLQQARTQAVVEQPSRTNAHLDQPAGGSDEIDTTGLLVLAGAAVLAAIL